MNNQPKIGVYLNALYASNILKNFENNSLIKSEKANKSFVFW
jgi:hypothetical protein